MATRTDPKSFSRAELIKERDRLEAERQRIDAELAAQAKGHLQSLVDTFKMHLEENDFTLAEALSMLGGGKKTRAKRGTAKPPKVKDYEVGVTYKNPNNAEQKWVGGTKGPKPKWLKELLDGGR